jgi:acetaldehyde dehydrogenase (acetylating)
VNTPATHGSIGLTTGLDPAMTLGCGGWGGNITSDNISPRHLLNIKRLAYEITPAVGRFDQPVGAAVRQPAAPVRPPTSRGISAEALTSRIDEFLGSRGFKAEARVSAGSDRGRIGVRPVSDTVTGRTGVASQVPLDFVCEEDVRLAIQAGRKLVVAERAIVTPAARELGEQHRVFAAAPWRG